MLADRTQLIAAAERAISLLGPDVTMDQIAAEAEVTKPILYRTIGDKAAVVDALSEVLVERIGLAVSTSATPGMSRREAFTASVKANLTAVDADRNLYLFVSETDQQSGPTRRRIDRSARQLVELFENEQALGSSSAPLTWAHSIVGALQTVALMWIDPDGDDRDRRTIDDIAADITELFWPGFAAILGADPSPTD